MGGPYEIDRIFYPFATQRPRVKIDYQLKRSHNHLNTETDMEMIIKCAWCNRLLENKELNASDGQNSIITHSICDSCKTIFNKDLPIIREKNQLDQLYKSYMPTH